MQNAGQQTADQCHLVDLDELRAGDFQSVSGPLPVMISTSLRNRFTKVENMAAVISALSESRS